jgi:uncharacterized protein with GYD domain
MQKYLIEVSYSQQGIKGLLKDGGSKRRAVTQKAFADLGGKVEAFYFSFGSSDVYLIAELPDNIMAAAISLAVSASGAGAVRTTVLLTPEEIDQAARKKIGYRAPGK